MGGKKKQKIPVADYHMSIHFGICKGPLDAINQIYIKEEPVWCGRIVENSIVYADLPELFGGDKKEGGVAGAMECYMGTSDQLMLATTASRYGLTPTTMPGYRGVANVMFRGFQPEESDQRAPAKRVTGPGFLNIFSAFTDAFVAFLEAATPTRAESTGGFKWMSNNPYLPGAWVNATRMPKTLSEQFSTIYSGEPDFAQRNFVLGIQDDAPELRSIESLGYTPEEVDAGLITITMEAHGTVTGTGLAEGADMRGLLDAEAQFWEANADGTPYRQIGGTRIGDQLRFVNEGRVYAEGVAPPNTRYVRFLVFMTRSSPLFSTQEITFQELTATKLVYGPSWCVVKKDLGVLPDANPAHMLHEFLTNRDWGMGAPREAINEASFLAAAELFYNEKFGLSILWSEQTDIEKYASEILDHVQAAMFIDPSTGLWTLKPFRADYDVTTLPVLDPSNCTATNRQRKALGETVNEIVVEWTNPNNEQGETVTFQDLGNIAAQGGVVSATRNYYGIRNLALANMVGARDIRSAAYPLFSVNIQADRTMSRLTPGAVVKFSWPEDGIEEMILRVLKVDYGKPGDAKIKIEATEDVFGLEVTEYTSVQKTLWVEADDEPEPLDYAEFITTPLPLLLRSGVTLAELTDDQYPQVGVAVLAASAANNVEFFTIHGQVVNPSGSSTLEPIGALAPTATAVLNRRLTRERESFMSDFDVRRFTRGAIPSAGDFLHVEGEDGDRSSEIVMLDGLETGVWRIARGMFDTAIRDWPVGTRLWFLGDSVNPQDPNDRSDGLVAAYRLTPKSAGGELEADDAPVLTFTPSDRPYAPFRPTALTITPVGGVKSPLTPYPWELENPDAEAGMTGWTAVNIQSLAAAPGLNPKTGSRLFAASAGVASASMEQRLSIPLTRWAQVDAGELEMSLRWWQAGFDTTTDPCHFEIEFYDELDALISTEVTPDSFGGAEAWVARDAFFTAPVLARSYVIRINMVRTGGVNLNCYIDSIRSNLEAGEFPALAFTGPEVPTSLTLSWAERNRLTQDTVATKWGAPTTTPEVGQTTTVRVVDSVTGAVEFEATGITSLTYDLTLGALLNYRFYRIEVSAERDGYESIQSSFREIQVVQLGYGNNYGFDYGENDGS